MTMDDAKFLECLIAEATYRAWCDGVSSVDGLLRANEMPARAAELVDRFLAETRKAAA